MNKYIWAFIESSSTVVFQFLSLIILSRMLTPTDYGIFGAMSIFIAIGTMIADSGMGAALVKKRNPSELDYSTLFCFNLATSFIYYLILMLISSLIANFYHIEELSLCLKIYGLFVIVSAFGLVQNVQLNRNLKIREIAFINLVSNIFALFLAVYLAYNGWGYWSLIFQHLLSAILRVMLQLFCNKFIPKVAFSKSSFREQFGYSSSILASNILNVLYSNLASTIIPKIGTIQQNGYYLQASRIQLVPLTILNSITDRVLFPILCQVKEEDLLTTARLQIKKLSAIVSIGIFFMFLFSKPLIVIILGENWETSADYLLILLLSSYFLAYQYLLRSIFKATGFTKKILEISFIQSILGFLVLLISSLGGIEVLLWGFVLVSFIVTLYYMKQIKMILKYTIYNQIEDNILVLILYSFSMFLQIFYF